MVISFKQLKDLVDKLDKRIPNYEKVDTQVIISLSELDNTPIRVVQVGGYLGTIKMTYSKERHCVNIKQGVTQDRYFEPRKE